MSADAHNSIARGKLYIVATPIGNLGDITERAREILGKVSRIAAEDTRRTGKLLKALDVDGQLVALHAHNEAASTRGIIEILGRGEDVALVSDAGTPLISDPGYELVVKCREQGINVIPVPGASAVVTALSVAGIPTNRFSFEGFLPSKAKARAGLLKSLANEERTMVFYEVPHRIKAALDDVVANMGEARELSLCRELTKTYEQVVTGTALDLLSQVQQGEIPQKGEFVLVIRGDSSGLMNDADPLLSALLDELAPSRAAALAAKLTGQTRDVLYQRALELSRKDDERPA